MPAKRGPKRSARTENPRTIAVAATTLISNMLTVLAPDSALVRTSCLGPSPDGGKRVTAAVPMTRFIDAFKNQRVAMAITDALLGGLLSAVIDATITLIGKHSGNSFKAVANDF